MNGLTRLLAAAILIGTTLAAPSARATQYLITYTGTVFDSDNRNGAFGIQGSLDGQAFTAVYTLTYPTPGALEREDYDKTGRSIEGGAEYGTPSPVSAMLTINGITLSFDGTYDGFAGQSDQTLSLGSGPSPRKPADQVDHRASYSSDANGHTIRQSISNAVYSDVNNIVSTTDFTSSLNYLVDLSDDISTGQFIYYDYSAGAYQSYVSGQFLNSSVTIAPFVAPPPPLDSVPEPSTWAMMIAGFGLTGFTMRRRRRTLKPALGRG